MAVEVVTYKGIELYVVYKMDVNDPSAPFCEIEKVFSNGTNIEPLLVEATLDEIGNIIINETE